MFSSAVSWLAVWRVYPPSASSVQVQSPLRDNWNTRALLRNSSCQARFQSPLRSGSLFLSPCGFAGVFFNHSDRKCDKRLLVRFCLQTPWRRGWFELTLAGPCSLAAPTFVLPDRLVFPGGQRQRHWAALQPVHTHPRATHTSNLRLLREGQPTAVAWGPHKQLKPQINK